MSTASLRRFIPAFLIVCALAVPTTAQSASDSNSGVAEAEKRLAEETDRLDKKKAACSVEFGNLVKPSVQKELASDAAAAVLKHKDAIRTQVAEAKAMGANSGRRARTTSEAALADEVRAAFESRVGRNLAGAPVCDILIDNVLDGINGGLAFKTEDCVKNAIGEVFSGPDFEKNWTSALADVFGKKVKEAKATVDAAKRLALEAAEAEKVTAAGGIPGMILVPEGEYVIGLDVADIEKLKTLTGYAKKDTFPQSAYGFPAHKQKFESFFMDQNEVTNRWYQEFCRETGHKPPKHWISPEAARREKPAGVDGLPGESARSIPVGANEGAKGDDRVPPLGLESAPVGFITLEDAKAFAVWCGRRIPTEFEWEAAARYRKVSDKVLRLFPWGDTYNLAKPLCNTALATSTAQRQKFRTVTPVGLWPDSKSTLGFNDLAGNALEMTVSPFDAYPGFKPDKAPKGTPDRPFDPDFIVCRGGSATTNDLYSATSMRFPLRSEETSWETVGFRTVASQNRTRDFVALTVASSRTGAALVDAGKTLKDEGAAKVPVLNTLDPDRSSALISGGWNTARNVPAQAKWIGAISRATKEFNSDQRLRDLAREAKEPVLLGYFSTDVDLKGVPAGAYAVMWNAADTKLRGKDNNPWPDGVILKKAGDVAVLQPTSARMVLVGKSTEKTKVKVSDGGKRVTVVFTYLVKDMKDARMTLELAFDADPANVKDFR